MGITSENPILHPLKVSVRQMNQELQTCVFQIACIHHVIVLDTSDADDFELQLFFVF